MIVPLTLAVASLAASPAVAVESPAPAITEPRIEWLQLEALEGPSAAVDAIDRWLAAGGDASTVDADYLRGRLLKQLGRLDAAATAFSSALGSSPDLAPWIRLRLAQVESARDHPEVAAGLLATLLAASPAPPERLAALAVRELIAALEQGGDCRLIAGSSDWSLEDEERRSMALMRASCALSTTGPRPALPAIDRARSELARLLDQSSTDGVAYEAAVLLHARGGDPEPETLLTMAEAFFTQRDFELALDYYARALDPAVAELEVRTDYEHLYAIARSEFWLGRHESAASRFAELASMTADRRDRAQASYQQARSLELAGRRGEAETAFAAAGDADPDGDWAAAELVSRLRLALVDGREEEAITLYRRLGERRRWRGSRARAGLFLAATDLVQTRADRAGAWLAEASATPGTHQPEIRYWQGRHAELEERFDDAIRAYAGALADDPFDPWARAGRERLTSPALDAARVEFAAQALADPNAGSLYRGFLLFTAPGEIRDQLRDALIREIETRADYRDFTALQPVPIDRWPLWQIDLQSPPERLLAVGDVALVPAAAARQFPSTDERLALTRAQLLAAAGRPRAAILTAELLVRRAAGEVPRALWPGPVIDALYPLAFGALLVAETTDRGLDPRLLAGLIREESRFDATALSPAAARGLTQFVLPTARRLATELEMAPLRASELFDPAVAILLGAVYLEELRERFGPIEPHMLAAYNAGEPQTELWRSYCRSGDRAEFMTKIGFRETRNYVRKVLRSYGVYRELYPVLPTTLSGIVPGRSSK